MSWITNGARILNVGSDAAEVLGKVFLDIRELNEAEGKSPLEAVKALLRKRNIPVDRKALLELLRSKLAENEKEEVERLLTSLGDLERRDGAPERTIAGLAKEWSKPDLELDSQLRLDLSAGGSVAYVVDADGVPRPEGLPPIGQNKASAAFRIEGKAGARLEAGAGGAVGANFAASADRSITYYLSYPNQTTLSGLAFAGAIRRLAPPYDWEAVLDGFQAGGPGNLDAVRISGRAGLAANANVGVSVPTGQGMAGISFKGRVAFSNEFQVTVTNPAPDVLRADVDVSNPLSHSTEVGLSYSVGLSSLAPNAARRLLARTSKAGEFLEKIDKLTDEIEGSSWLKPGTLLRDEIREYLAGQVGGDGPEATLFQRGLARLFALDGAEKFDEQLEKLVVEQATELLTAAVDDALGILNGDTEALEKWFDEVIEKEVGARLREKLQTAVLDKLPDLDEKLKSAADQMDGAAEKALEKALGKPVGDRLDDVRAVIEDARELLARINEGIQASVDELIGIEVGFARQRSRETRFDYTVRFGKDAHAEYARAILAPKKFGEYLLASPDIDGLEVEGAIRRTLLSRSASSEFGISLATLELQGGTTLSSEVDVVHTETGVAAVSRAELARFTKFLNEKREASFLSANAIFLSRHIDSAPELEGDDVPLPEGAPAAAPKLALKFRETDGKLKLGEVRKLLSRLAESGLVDDDAHAEILTAFRSESDGEHIAGSLTISLAIPPLSIPILVRYGAANPDSLRSAMRSLMAEHLESEIRHLVREYGIREADDPDAFVGAADFLLHIDRIIEITEARFDDPGFRRARGHLRFTDFVKPLRDIRNDIDVLGNVFRAGNEILDLDAAPGDDVAGILEDKQEEMVGHVKPFLRAGLPLPEWVPFGGKIPVRTVLLFDALQTVAAQALGVRPPLVVQLKPEGKPARTFIAPPAPEA
ncbi:MAG: hypothetical protein ACNS61_14275 [Candidatus Wenzhouxiangella sp. M2_3B_020]